MLCMYSASMYLDLGELVDLPLKLSVTQRLSLVARLDPPILLRLVLRPKLQLQQLHNS